MSDMLALEELRRKAEAVRSLPPAAERRAIRVAAGLSQDEIAAAFDPPVHRETVSRWERGDRNPHGVRLEQYLQILNAIKGDAAA